MKFFTKASLATMSFALLSLLACADDESQSSTSPESGAACLETDSFEWLSDSTYRTCVNGTWSNRAVEKHTPGFDPCQFNFGAAWQASHEDLEYYDGVDYIAVWLGDNDFYNSFEKRMVDACVEIGATPMVYGYVIAEFGKDRGLEDCDVAKTSTTSLCVGGANLIRQYFADSILYRYQQYASGMREQVEFFLNMDPNTFESIWMIEPDFYQYSESGSEQKFKFDGIAQLDGGIPDKEMGKYFKQIVDTIKAYLPAAKIAIDISPWVLDQEAWYSNFDLSVVDFASTSGGRTSAASEKIRAGNIAGWEEIAKITGKPVLADAGYDAGGAGTGHAKIWDKPENINARISNGVIGVMQMDAALDYPAMLTKIRPQVTAKVPGCKN